MTFDSKRECWQLTCQFPIWRLCSFDRGNSMYEQQTWMLTIGLLNRNTDSWRTSEKVSWEKGRARKIFKNGYLGWLGVTQGHLQCHNHQATLWCLTVIRSNDRTILYYYRRIAWYYVKNRIIFQPPYNLPRRSPSPFNWPHQICWTVEHIGRAIELGFKNLGFLDFKNLKT